MLNQVVIVGRLVKDPEIKIIKDGRKVSFITLAVNRPYKNPVTGIYDTDFIGCTLWEGIAQATANHCKKGGIVGVKGRLATRITENENHRIHTLELIAEKVTFISTNKNKEDLAFENTEDEIEE
jgi:single-strand DNA-binding protein